MTRAPFQILVFPFTIVENDIFFALFRRYPRIGGYWEGIAGGGEDEETPLDAARREAFEEAGIMPDAPFVGLKTFEMLPLIDVSGFLLLPQYTFGVAVDRHRLTTRNRLTEVTWTKVDSAMKMVPSGSSQTALCELYFRLRNEHS